MSSGVPTPFSGIVITGLVLVGLFVAFAAIGGGLANTFGLAETDTSYQNITAQSGALTGISQQSSDIFFTNQTTTAQQTSTDRLLSSAYSVFLVLGYLPAVFSTVVNTIVTVTAGVLGIPPGLAAFIDAGIMMIIIGTIVYLAVGRR